MTDTQLRRRRFLGRGIRPYAFFVSLATALLVASVAANVFVGALFSGWPGHAVALIALFSVGALWWGWWDRSDVWMARGLLWSSGVWSGVASLLAVDDAWWLAAWALCWSGASGAAWWLEHDDLVWRRGGR